MLKTIWQNILGICNIYMKFSHSKVLFYNLVKLDNKIFPDIYHLKAAIEWLCRAQDITNCGGVSYGYSFKKGWLPPYPETTGYIISTFLQSASFLRNQTYIKRAEIMGDWEIKIQLTSGAVRGGMGINNYPSIFNTGQVILGWISLFEETKKKRFLKAAIRAAEWLLKVQDNDGKWSKHTFMGILHAYHTRVAWSLLKVYKYICDEKYKQAAEKNILWALTHVKETGWFKHMGFETKEIPFTHTIAYTLRGLFESSFYFEKDIKQKILEIIQKAAKNILMKYISGTKNLCYLPMYIPGKLDERWQSNVNYSCLTGNIQISIILLKLYNLNNDVQFLNASLQIINQIKAIQSLSCKNMGINGAIPGSYPIWGEYQKFTYPNWATKFFCDALLLKNRVMIS